MKLSPTQLSALRACYTASGRALIYRDRLYRTAFIGGDTFSPATVASLVRAGMFQTADNTVTLTAAGLAAASKSLDEERDRVRRHGYAPSARLALGSRLAAEQGSQPAYRPPYRDD